MNDSQRSAWGRSVHAILLSGAAGVALAAAWVEGEDALQGYSTLGFQRTVHGMWLAQTTRLCALGLALGLALALGCALLRRLSTDPERWSEPAFVGSALRGALRHPRALLAGCALLIVGFVLAALARGGLSRAEIFAASAMLVVWCGWTALELRAREERGSHESFAPRAALVGLGLVIALLLFLVREPLYFPFRVSGFLGDRLLAVSVAIGAAFALWRVLERARAPGALRFKPWDRIALTLAEAPVLAPLALVAWGSSIHAAFEPARPLNVILIGIDTLRADHTTLLGVANGGRDLTPNLAALARRGTVFTEAISQAPWTMPAFASILTGKYPHQHGAISKTGEVRKREVTLAEVLHEAGYTTGAIVSHHFVNNARGFGQGFDSFDNECVRGEVAITSGEVSDHAVRFLERHKDERFFLFVHYFDPHYEYRDHPESTFADGYHGWLSREMHVQNVRHKRHLFGDEERQYLRDLYDEEIVHTDRELGRVLAEIESAKLADDTLVVLVADHGEEFLERGWIGHSTTLYDEVIHVPLFFVVPGLGGTRTVAQTVETRSVFSTVLDVLGVDYGIGSRPPSLLPLARGEGGPAVPARAISSVWTPDAKPDSGMRAQITSLRTDEWKLIWDHARGKQFLYDVRADPGELHDLAHDAPEKLAEMVGELESFVRELEVESRSAPRNQVDAETAKQLQALGYM